LMLIGGAQIDSSSYGAGRGGQLTVTAEESISLADSGLFSNTFGMREAGNLTVETGKLVLTDGALIDSSSFGAGQGGKLTVTAKESISISGRVDKPTGLFSTTSGSGNAGGLVVITPLLVIQEGLILTSSLGARGGNAGDLTLEVGKLVVTDGAKIRSDTRGSKPGGKLTVRAKESVTIAGRDREGNPSALSSATSGSGNAGGLVVSTPILIMPGGLILTNSDKGSSGDAGSLTVETSKLMLTDGAQMDSSSFGAGRGGKLTITAKDSISIAGHDTKGNSSGLLSTASGSGNAGSLTVEAGSVTLTGGAVIKSGGLVIIRSGQLVLDRAFIDTSTAGSGGERDVSVEAGSVTLTGSSEIKSGGAIFVRGGRLAIDGSIISAATLGDADGGRIDLDLTGDLAINNFGGILAATLGNGRGGNISVKAKSITLTGGAEINSTTALTGQGGDLTIIAADFIFISGRSSEGFSGLVANALKEGNAGSILVFTPSLKMDDGVIQALTVGDGNAGDIALKVGSLTLRGGAQISTASGSLNLRTGEREVGRGRGGNLSIIASDVISISGRDSRGFPSALFTETDGSGNAGHISISTPTLQMADGRISSATTGDGRGGDLMIKGGSLTLTGDAQIASASGSTTRVGSGQGGNLTITADDLISISGRDSTISSTTFGSGDAGNVSISASMLKMEDGGEIQAGGSDGRAGDIKVNVGSIILTGGAAINNSTAGSGQGGNLIISATDLISISGQDSDGVGSGIASGTLGRGRGGNIELQARQIELNDGGVISARSSGQGDAGNIVIQAGQIFQSRNGAVTTEAETADGGNISLTVGSLIDLRESQITATVRSGVGQGGNITIDPPAVVLQRSQIRADAFGGPGGNVRIVAEVFLADPDSQVSASSALGIAGTVNIQAPVTSLSGALAPLPQAFVNVAALLPARCAARLSGGTTSSLVLGGRDGLPLDPSGVLPSPLVLDDQLVADPAVTGEPHRQTPTSRFALLAGDDKVFARMKGGKGLGFSPAALDLGCSQGPEGSKKPRTQSRTAR
jgi:large exoprotein involved in heme utilization and adhesion